LARYDSNGTLDAAFGNAGVVVTDLGGPEQSYAVVVQADGKIVVAGEAYDSDTGWEDILLVRYTMDGVLDAGFGNGGVVLTDFGNNGYDGSTSVALQADGKIVVAGATEGTHDDFALARYDTRVIGAASVAGEPVSIGETNVRARFNAGGPCTVSVTKTIAFPASSSVFGRMPMYWDISTDCSGAYDLTLILCYTDAELYNGVGVTEDELAVFKRMGGQKWENQGGTVDPEANCATLNNVTSLGSWTLGSPPFHIYLPLVAKP
jgi:uncharacterized delta-60 repeat protein